MSTICEVVEFALGTGEREWRVGGEWMGGTWHHPPGQAERKGRGQRAPYLRPTTVLSGARPAWAVLWCSSTAWAATLYPGVTFPVRILKTCHVRIRVLVIAVT